MIIYTCIVGGKDKLREFDKHGVRAIAFLDKLVESPTWSVRTVLSNGNPRLIARRIKIMGQFPEEYSLWLDGVFSLRTTMKDLVDKHLKDADVAFLPHPERDCLYAEADACLLYGLENPTKIHERIDRYRAEGCPAHRGLYASGAFLVRNNPRTRIFRGVWWNEVITGIVRDQICLPYALWKTGITPALMDWKDFDLGRHLIPSTRTT